MQIAFYAPLKSPDHPVPSGDRQMARWLIKALECGGHQVVVASQARSYCRTPDAQALKMRMEPEINRLAEMWRKGAGTAPVSPPDHQDFDSMGTARASGFCPQVWFCYHPYYKAPDLIGPALCDILGMRYVTAEASYAGKRDRDEWRTMQNFVVDAVQRADVNFCFTPADREGLACITAQDRLADLAPFIDVGRHLEKRRRAAGEPVELICVAMMRRGVKLDSYTLLARSLALAGSADWRLTIVGGGPQESEVRRLFARFAPERINWAGELAPEDVRRQLCLADLFVWPGYGEAYGLAYLEAQSCGLPVVAQNTHGVPSVVDDAVSGFLVRRDDAAAFANAVDLLIGDEALRAQMSRQAVRFIRAGRTVEAAATALNAGLSGLAHGAFA